LLLSSFSFFLFFLNSGFGFSAIAVSEELLCVLLRATSGERPVMILKRLLARASFQVRWCGPGIFSVVDSFLNFDESAHIQRLERVITGGVK